MTSVAGDQTLLSTSMDDNPHTFDFVDRQVVRVHDSNNGNYSSGQVRFDFAPLASSAAFSAYSEAVMYIPMHLSLATSGTFTVDHQNAFAMSLKGSDFSLVNSMSVILNSTEVVGAQNLSQIPITYKLLTSLSGDSWSPNRSF